MSPSQRWTHPFMPAYVFSYMRVCIIRIWKGIDDCTCINAAHMGLDMPCGQATASTPWHEANGPTILKQTLGTGSSQPWNAARNRLTFAPGPSFGRRREARNALGSSFSFEAETEAVWCPGQAQLGWLSLKMLVDFYHCHGNSFIPLSG